MQSLPVLDIVPQLKEKLLENRIVILQAPPGAGKSTLLPLQLLDESWLHGQKMIMLEPRRLAARAVAHRMAGLLEEAPGDTVGFRIRFENKISSRTRIEVVTEGILTRMIQSNNDLDGVGLVIFDEFHERSLQADLALALCLQVQDVLRDDLRILIMSATLDGDRLSSILHNAPIVSSVGKQFPVEHRYYNFDPQASVPVRMARAVRKALSENAGDILAFLPGAGEISKTRELLESETIGATVCALFGDLPMKQQQEAIVPFPDGRRKVVLATSVAETSLTIEGITVVVDSGYARVPRFDPRSGLTRLETIRVTRDAADQRAGRAGRTGPGVCYRLWSEGMTASLVSNRSPEILDADLASLVLELSAWGVNDVANLTWITPPPAGAVNQAKELLDNLDALSDGLITDRGKKMLRLPTHPRLAHMLLSMEGSLATDVAALLEERDPMRESGADLTLRVEALRKWRKGEKNHADRNALERIERQADAWRKILKVAVDNAIPLDQEVGKLLLLAYPERIARQTEKHSERYKLANGRIAKLPSHDPLTREPWLVVAHLDAGSGEGKIFLAAPVDENDLQLMAREKEVIAWDSLRGMVVGAIEKSIGGLVLKSRSLLEIPAEKRMGVLARAIREEGLKMIGWSRPEEEWQARMMSLRQWRPGESWPDVSDQALLDTLETWLFPYLLNAAKRTDLQKLDLNGILSGLLPWELSARFEALVPARIAVPSGSMISLLYFSDGRPPVMEVRLQEVFGLLETPVINDGRTQVVMHLLSPGFKPVQVTRDLKSFWQSTYHEVRKELRMRYPRHSWPEDPLTAKAVRGAKKRYL